MEKIIIAIIILNIIVSIYTKKQKQKKLQEAAGKKYPSAKPGQEGRQELTSINQSRKKAAEIPKDRRDAKPLNKHLETGKSFLQEFIKELGIEIPQPEDPVTNESKRKFNEEANPEWLTQGSILKENAPAIIKPVHQKRQKKREPEETAPKKKLFQNSFIISQLEKRSSVQTAFILKTILDRPKALQHLMSQKTAGRF